LLANRAQGIVQIQNVPVPIVFAAHGHGVAHEMFLRRIQRVIVGIPQSIAIGLHIKKRHFVTKIRRVFKIALSEILHHLRAAAEFSVSCVPDDVWIEAVCENGGIALLEGIGTVVHVRFH
jgi:hypothetical protein